jgi:dihydrofolate reductase
VTGFSVTISTMKTTIVAAISKDGFLTKGSNPNPGDWTSDEDKDFYKSILEKNNLYLMGSKTFSFAKNTLPAHAQKIVMSHNANEQSKLPNTYFSDKSFQEVINKFSDGYSQLLVIGGANIYHQMLEQYLVDEAFITVEPIINHSGILFYNSKNYFENLGFELVSKKTLNSNGTVLNHYVLKK